MDGSQATTVEAEDLARCADCATVLVGRFCHECGDDSRPPSRRLRDIAEDFLEEVFDFSAPALRTAKALFTRPSLVPRALRAGDRKSFLSPMKLYLTATVVFFLFLGLADVSMVQWQVVPKADAPLKVVVENGELKRLENFLLTDRWLHRTEPHPRNDEAVAAFDAAAPQITDEIERAIVLGTRAMAAHPSEINEAIGTWMPRILWLMMPLYALLLWAFYARGRLLSEHVILALWAHTMIFLLLIGGALWNVGVEALFGALGREITTAKGLSLGLLVYQVYFTLGLKGYYEQSWTGAVVKGLAHTFVYVGLIWFPLSVAILMFGPAAEFIPAGYFTE